MSERTCRECDQRRHGRCDSVDAFANHDYCGPRPICSCFDDEPEWHDTERFRLRREARHG